MYQTTEQENLLSSYGETKSTIRVRVINTPIW